MLSDTELPLCAIHTSSNCGRWVTAVSNFARLGDGLERCKVNWVWFSWPDDIRRSCSSVGVCVQLGCGRGSTRAEEDEPRQRGLR